MNARKLARRAVRKGAVQKVSELSPLISLLKKRKLRTLVEIGTQKGGTLYAWCKIAEPDALIVSIDLPGGPFGGGYSLVEMKKFRAFKRKNQTMYLLRKDSHKKSTKDALLRKIKGRKIDFLFIDGDHRYRGVKKDWTLYAPLVKRNGVIAFHDILFHPEMPRCKVDRLWNEIKRQYQNNEFIDKYNDRGWGQWGGIGVIYYK
jgi:23S rRNA U2552 (ribose-2'-O)-methylase RlmE/FtsJ